MDHRLGYCKRCRKPNGTNHTYDLCSTCIYQDKSLELLSGRQSSNQDYSHLPITQRPGWQLTGVELIVGIIGIVFAIWFLNWLWELTVSVVTWIWNVVTWPFRFTWQSFENVIIASANMVGINHDPAWWETSILLAIILAIGLYLIGAFMGDDSDTQPNEKNNLRNIILGFFSLSMVAIIACGIWVTPVIKVDSPAVAPAPAVAPSPAAEAPPAPAPAPVVEAPPAPAVAPPAPVAVTPPALTPYQQNIKKLVDGLGANGWAKCAVGQIGIEGLIKRGDNISAEIKTDNQNLSKALVAMRQYLLSNGASESTLTQLAEKAAGSLKTGDQALAIQNGCVAEMNSILR